MVASFAYFAAMGVLLPTVPRFVEDELGGGGLQVGIGVGAFAVSAALLRPWVGRVGDARGRRVLAVGGSPWSACRSSSTPSPRRSGCWSLARLVTGAGEAAVFVGVATAAQDLAPDHRRGEAASYFSVALYGGLALGPPVGESLVATTASPPCGWCAAAARRCGAVARCGSPGARPWTATVGDRKFLQRDALWPGVILLLGLIPFTAFSSFVPLYAEDIGLDSVGGGLRPLRRPRAAGAHPRRPAARPAGVAAGLDARPAGRDRSASP